MPPSTVDGLRILVIGAGPAGLCSARHILASSHGTPFPKFAAPVVLERSGAIGGTWVYGDTPLYMSLRTNLPVEIMSFLDYPFPRNGPDDESYVHHSEVLTYLKQYVEHHDILKYVKFRQEVQLVERVTTGGDSGGTKWKVKWCDLDTNECHEDIFDAVMVCNGNYSKPFIPEIPGIECFQGDILHSKDYRVPEIEVFTGKEVVILGSSFSAIDISQDIAPVAKRVTICDRSCRKILKEFPDNVSLSGNINRAEEHGFILEDGTHCPADTLIYCTGYLYDIPFLGQNCKIEVLNGDFVRPLYKHIVNIEHPTMGFIGVPRLAIPFVLFDHQAQYYLKTLTGEIELPSQEDMWRESSQSTPGKGHILLHDAEWDYYKDLAKSAGLPTLPPVIKRIKNDSMCSLRREISPFKLFKYEVLDGENFKKTAIKTI
ncbi:flavin-containing monooxygenase FMO GS-OX-like 2 [Ischnura elegans]|uniref:flavin-containing monooxygenase FMO GS-OX-like 2 n=1 Tax=Ischnura elegans TaxID=197161 RepID=UPI001ED87402|nr:flavin-containing monooxygenase FMO GS-OX-like 2 [Ischnura elegans]XP_046402392.1 flavin-containing monooxygenase FMO GS-OX-like 2 [Ischnura elegans]